MRVYVLIERHDSDPINQVVGVFEDWDAARAAGDTAEHPAKIWLPHNFGHFARVGDWYLEIIEKDLIYRCVPTATAPR